MLYSRQTVFNKNLKATASEIIIKGDVNDFDEDEQKFFESFLNIIITEVDKKIDKFKLIIPEEFYPFLDDVSPQLSNKLSVKLTISSSNKDSLNLMTKINEDGYSLSIDVQDMKVLDILPSETEFVILDASYIDFLEEETLDFITSTYKCVAKGVDSYELMNELKAKNVFYYCGDFIEKPETLSGEVIAPNKTTVLTLIGTLNDPDVELSEVTKIFSADNVLSFKLLKIVNSPLYRGVSELKSVQDAIVRFGLMNLKKWVMMLSLCSLGNKPSALIKLALQRAIMCSRLAEHLKAEGADSFYTAGLLSTIDAFFDHPLESLLEEIAISDDIKRAILNHEGTIGNVLKIVTNYQNGDLSFNDQALAQIFVESTEETNQMLSAIGL